MFNYVTILLMFILLTSTPFTGKENSSATNKQAKTSIAWTASWSRDERFVAIGNDHGELAVYETRQWKKVKSWNYKATTITRIEWNLNTPYWP